MFSPFIFFFYPEEFSLYIYIYIYIYIKDETRQTFKNYLALQTDSWRRNPTQIMRLSSSTNSRRAK